MLGVERNAQLPSFEHSITSSSVAFDGVSQDEGNGKRGRGRGKREFCSLLTDNGLNCLGRVPVLIEIFFLEGSRQVKPVYRVCEQPLILSGTSGFLVQKVFLAAPLSRLILHEDNALRAENERSAPLSEIWSCRAHLLDRTEVRKASDRVSLPIDIAP